MIGDFTVFLESRGTHNKIIQLCIVQIQRLLTWHCLYYLGSKGILRILHTPYKTTSWFAPWYSRCSHHFLITMAVIPDYVSDHMKLRSTFISCTLILIGQLGSRSLPLHQLEITVIGKIPVPWPLLWMFSSLLALSEPWYQGNCFPFISCSWQPFFSYKPFLIRSRNEGQVFRAPRCFFWIIFPPFFLNTFESYAFRLYHLIAVICQPSAYSLLLLQNFSSWPTFYETTPIITHDEFLSM